jgi:uncharacterized protein YdaU (DUF1376 family)
MENTATSHIACASHGIQILLLVMYSQEKIIPPINKPREHKKLPNGLIKYDRAIV